MNLQKILFIFLLILTPLLPSCDTSDLQSNSDSPNSEDPPEKIANKEENPLSPVTSNPEAFAQSRSPNLANECVNLALSNNAIDIGVGLPNGYEPSGADWHPRLHQVFSVHDNGYLFSMNKDGSEVRTWNIGGDLEGVTIANPQSDFVYIGREFPAAILEFNIVTGLVTRTFSLGGANGMPESSSQ